MATFRLLTENGDPIDPFRVESWEPGNLIPREGRSPLRVVDVLEPAPGQTEGTLVVEST